MSLKYWVLGDALRHISICVMVVHSTIVQFASVAWKFIALADSFILERFQTNIPVVWDVKLCIFLCMYQRFGRAFSLQLSPFALPKHCVLYTDLHRVMYQKVGIVISSAVRTRNVAVQRKFVAL